MSLMRSHANDKAGFTLYFLGYPGSKGVPAEGQSTADREGLLELTWNHGTEKDEAFSYHDGNRADSEGKQGFGHICKFSVSTLKASKGQKKELILENRCDRRQPRCCLPKTRGLESELEEEADGWADEERCLRTRPGRLLGRGCSERAVRRQGQLLNS